MAWKSSCFASLDDPNIGLRAVHWNCDKPWNIQAQGLSERWLICCLIDYFPTADAKVVGHNKELREGRGDQENVYVVVDLEGVLLGQDQIEPFKVRIPINKGEMM